MANIKKEKNVEKKRKEMYTYVFKIYKREKWREKKIKKNLTDSYL